MKITIGRTIHLKVQFPPDELEAVRDLQRHVKESLVGQSVEMTVPSALVVEHHDPHFWTFVITPGDTTVDLRLIVDRLNDAIEEYLTSLNRNTVTIA